VLHFVNAEWEKLSRSESSDDARRLLALEKLVPNSLTYETSAGSSATVATSGVFAHELKVRRRRGGCGVVGRMGS
jgi:hypothetical protein